MLELRSACTLVLFAGAAALLPPTASGLGDRGIDSGLREFASWCLRPARLPFAWQALQSATRSGDAQEALARGQQIMQLVPSWTDGHAAMAYRYVLTQSLSADPATAASAAAKRLQVGLGLLEQARPFAGKREYSLLHAAAFLPDIACGQFPGLAELLQKARDGGAAAIANDYFTEAERLFPSPAIREQRLFHAPKLAASLLACGAKAAALAVIDDAIAHAPEIRNQKLATEWATRLQELAAWLRGDRSVRLDALRQDPRFELLQPFLHD